MEERRREVLSVLEDILLQVKRKQENLYATPTYEEHTFDLARLDEIYARVETLEKDATECGAKLKEKHTKAQTALRLSEVARFKEDIGYDDQVKAISEKEAELEKKEQKEKRKRQFAPKRKRLKPRKGFARMKRKGREGSTLFYRITLVIDL